MQILELKSIISEPKKSTAALRQPHSIHVLSAKAGVWGLLTGAPVARGR